MTGLETSFIPYFILIGLCAFFSSSEVALTGLSVPQINRLRRKRPHVLRMWEEEPDRILATLLLSNTAVHIATGVWAAGLSIELSTRHGWNRGIVSSVVGLVCGFGLFYFGEMLPKVVARHFSDLSVLLLTPPLRVLCRLVSPLANVAVKATRAVGIGKKDKDQEDKPFYMQEVEFKKILSHAAIPHESRKILDNVVDFSASTVLDVMIPREQIVAVSKSEGLPKIIQRVVDSGFSRVPVFEKNMDNIVGLLYAKDLLVGWRTKTLVVLDDLLRPVFDVTPDMLLSELLRQFKSGRQHMAIVKTKTPKGQLKILGIVTLQDALESIVGSISEEA